MAFTTVISQQQRCGVALRRDGAAGSSRHSRVAVRAFSQDHGTNFSATSRAFAAAAVALMLTLTPMPAQANTVIQGPARVVDGDTLVINQQRIRLFGIDAPEKAQSCRDTRGAEYSCGQRSKEALTAKVGTQAVTCNVKNQDQYGRNVSVCSLAGGPFGPGEELNSWLVKNGLAVAYRQFGNDYVPLEEAAKAQHVGVWEGPFTPPNEWRKQQKAGGGGSGGELPSQLFTNLQAAPSAATLAKNLANNTAAPPPSCPGGAEPIKGNISAKGSKIYHMPGGKNYNQVKIETAEGERYFCSESEAQAAGWTAAKN